MLEPLALAGRQELARRAERVRHRRRVGPQRRVPGTVVVQHEPAADGVVGAADQLGAVGVPGGAGHAVRVEGERAPPVHDQVLARVEARPRGARRAGAARVSLIVAGQPGRRRRCRSSRGRARSGPRARPGRCRARARSRRASRTAPRGRAASAAAGRTPSSASTNRFAARIGPTVCELDGPMPTVKSSKTLTTGPVCLPRPRGAGPAVAPRRGPTRGRCARATARRSPSAGSDPLALQLGGEHVVRPLVAQHEPHLLDLRARRRAPSPARSGRRRPSASGTHRSRSPGTRPSAPRARPRRPATRVWQEASRSDLSMVVAQVGPTVWITQRAGRSPAIVATASPVGSPSRNVVLRTRRHASSSFGPGGPVDRPVDPAAAQHRVVRRVDDGVDLLRGEVAEDERDRGHGLTLDPRCRRTLLISDCSFAADPTPQAYAEGVGPVEPSLLVADGHAVRRRRRRTP